MIAFCFLLWVHMSARIVALGFFLQFYPTRWVGLRLLSDSFFNEWQFAF